MTAARTVRISLWLLPADPDAAWLRERMQQLATRHGGPAFEPHVTLHVGPQSVDLAVEPLMAAQARQARPLVLECADTAHSDAYYKALFVRLAADRADGAGLRAMRHCLVAALETAGAPASDYAFDPHLSLLYGNFDAAVRQELAAAQRLSGRRIRFDRVAAVRPAPGSVDLARVADWEIFGHCRLGPRE
jgi:2'-5' RNA ligase